MGLLNIFNPEPTDTARAQDDAFQRKLDLLHRGLDVQYERAKEYNRKRPAYVGTTNCDKCGNYARHDTQYKVHDYTNSVGEVFHDEWLARRCDGCGYKWNEAVVTK